MFINEFLNYIVSNTSGKKAIVYFHNLKYDFYLLKNLLTINNICEKDGSLYFVELYYRKKQIIFKDSYKLISTKLANFPATFGLDKKYQKKEAISYTFYNEENIYQSKHSIKKYEQSLKNNSDREIFNEAIKMKNKKGQYIFSYYEEQGTFNAINYYKYYLKYDCLVLKKGIQEMANKMKKLTQSNLHNYYTISSLTKDYFNEHNSFKDVSKCSGNLREFLGKAVKGGRCSVNQKIKKKIVTKKLADYDACSLYPSAIHRVCNEMGFPRGKPKQIKVYTKEELDKYDYYVVSIKIKKINKHQQIPFISLKDENGILRYINEVPEGGFIDVIDKITLEDYIKFHKIEYEIIDGIYYNQGFNKLFGENVEKLYKDRLVEKAKVKNGETEEEKKSGKIMQNLIKLMLNSSYGKTILKKSKTKKIIKKSGKLTNKYIINNFNKILEIEDLNPSQKIIKCNTIDDTDNLAIVGVITLSMSKRIMNEVMNIANDNNIKIYYQDTDSMHIDLDKVVKLEDLYYKEYNKILNGKNMGNFHVDFDLEGAKSDIYAVKSIFLGKKCYMDKLVSKNSNGDLIEGYHVRLKGVTQAGLNLAYNELGSPEKLFEHLAKGKSYEFTLNPKGSVSFEFSANGISTRKLGSFKRSVKF